MAGVHVAALAWMAAAEVLRKMLAELAAAEVVGNVVAELVREQEGARQGGMTNLQPEPEMPEPEMPEPEPELPGPNWRRTSKIRWGSNVNKYIQSCQRPVGTMTRRSSLRKAIERASSKQNRQQFARQDPEYWMNQDIPKAALWFLDGLTYETYHDTQTGTGGWIHNNGWVYDLRVTLDVAAADKQNVYAPPNDLPDIRVTFQEGPAEFSGDGLFALIDTDHSGSIEFAEFEKFWIDRKLLIGTIDEGSTCATLKRAKQFFSESDVEKSGRLDRSEFETLLAKVAKDEATTLFVSDWITHYLHPTMFNPVSGGSYALPAMGIRWNVPKGREPLTIVEVAKGMAAAKKGLVEGMELRELNGKSVDEIQFRKRDLSLDVDVILEKMAHRPLTLKLQTPALPSRNSNCPTSKSLAVTVTFDDGPGVLSADGLFSLIDTDHSHTIEFAEFEHFWRQVMIGNVDSNGNHLCGGTLEKIEQLFGKSHKSGALDRAEFETILAEVIKDDWEAIEDPETGHVRYTNRLTNHTQWSPPGSADVNEWLRKHLQGDNQQVSMLAPELPSMGIKWNVTTSGSLVVAFVAKGMAASTQGVSEGMVLKRLNDDDLQDLRQSGLDTNDLLEKLKSRPLTLHLQQPPRPQLPIKCCGTAVWTLRSIGPRNQQALYEAKIGVSETETLTGTIFGKEVILEGSVPDNGKMIAASNYNLRLRWASATTSRELCDWVSELTGETVCHGVLTKLTLCRKTELPQAPFQGAWRCEHAADADQLPTVEELAAHKPQARNGQVFICVLRTIVREECDLASKQMRAPGRCFLEVGDQVVATEFRNTEAGAERVRLDDGGWVSRVSKEGRPILMSESEFCSTQLRQVTAM